MQSHDKGRQTELNVQQRILKSIQQMCELCVTLAIIEYEKHVPTNQNTLNRLPFSPF